MLPFIGFIGPDIFGNKFWSYDENFTDLEGIEHETGNGSESSDSFAEAHFDENTGGWVIEDVVYDMKLVGMEVGFGHVRCWMWDEKVIQW